MMSLILLVGGCQTSPEGRPASVECSDIEGRVNLSQPIDTLNLISAAFVHRCFDLVIGVGAQAREKYRHKTFTLLKETASVFVPDGNLTDYVLESYERGFLSVLMAASYFKRDELAEAKVELRRLDHEVFAPLYNFGEDPINVLLSAVLWERLGDQQEARVDWLRLQDLPNFLRDLDPSIRSFAGLQIERIDASLVPRHEWRVYGLGAFPKVTWHLRFFGSQSGYFAVRPMEEFPAICVSDTGVRLPASSWFRKIAIRHSHAYHPLLNVQSWIRLPIGLVYSFVPVAAGAGIAVGGCMADAAIAGKHGGALCELSVKGGIVMMSKAPEVLEGALKPDLRHWEQLPAAFLVTSASSFWEEPCAREGGLMHELL
ncbi:MAG: hypothetical protein HZB35_07760 [Nitrospirae bacterium]|nr:hypothetical protein [Nitrospirota bacterium]